jgi:hypothetical protein
MDIEIFLNEKSKYRTRRRMDELLAMLAYLYVFRGVKLAGGQDPDGKKYGNNIKNHNRLSQFYKDGHDDAVLEAMKLVDDAWRPAVASKVDTKGNKKEARPSELCGVWLTILSLINNDFEIKKPEKLWEYYKNSDAKRLKTYKLSNEEKEEYEEATTEEKKSLGNPRVTDWYENNREPWVTTNLNWRRDIINKDVLRDCVELHEKGIISKKRTSACTNANKALMFRDGVVAPNVTDKDMVVEGNLHTDHFIRHADNGADNESNFWLVLANDNLRRGKRDWFEYFETEHDICLKEYLEENNLIWLTDKEAPKPDMATFESVVDLSDDVEDAVKKNDAQSA